MIVEFIRQGGFLRCAAVDVDSGGVVTVLHPCQQSSAVAGHREGGQHGLELTWWHFACAAPAGGEVGQPDRSARRRHACRVCVRQAGCHRATEAGALVGGGSHR